MKFSIIFLIGFLLCSVSSEMTAEQKNRCEQYTSIFENDTTELQYGYCENIHDGRGYTAGRAGFCTGTADALEVIKLYTAHKANNPLAKYIPELTRLAKDQSADVSKLHGYCSAWQEAAKDQLFKQCQDVISDEMYYKPAMAEATKTGVTTVLGKCAFYDTIIQHGGGDDPDSLGGVIKKTIKSMNGNIHGNEHDWILKFLAERRSVLLNGWHVSVDRVDAMVDLANKNNWNMDPPMHIKTRYHDQTIH